ncbi:MAG TPA: tRNA (adenosine(37)-N6)-threonylcarbamoyltransferase complex ATPase subunit type 1 TsaE [Syntrophomonadaceae bacterium]|nr:tRNA (adenosine(37)-N6)-threonylcarbamoyltransferase complex ATPase subunit type 1 TsaE [Syntrophomonadaceae bacterium]
MQLCIPHEEDMIRLGMSLASLLKGDEIIYLQGELGAGKTTLVRGILKGLGFEGRVTSPTFTLMNVYDSHPPVYHCDFYRLEGGDLTDLGLEDYLGKKGITIIEWPEIGASDLPQDALIINIELVDGDYDRERMVMIRASGPDHSKLLEELTAHVHISH